MEIDVKDLELGDEFIYSSNSTLIRAKVVRPVSPKTKQPAHNPLNKTFYKAVKCLVSSDVKTYSHTWNGKTRTWSKNEFNLSESLNVEKTVDLNWRNIWLIKKGKQ